MSSDEWLVIVGVLAVFVVPVGVIAVLASVVNGENRRALRATVDAVSAPTVAPASPTMEGVPGAALAGVALGPVAPAVVVAAPAPIVESAALAADLGSSERAHADPAPEPARAASDSRPPPSPQPPASSGQRAGAPPASGGVYGALRAAALPQPQLLGTRGGSSPPSDRPPAHAPMRRTPTLLGLSGTPPPLAAPALPRPPASAPRLSSRVEPTLFSAGERTNADVETPLLWSAVELFKQGIKVPRELEARWLVRLCGVAHELDDGAGGYLTQRQSEIMLRELHHAEADAKDRRDERAEPSANGASAAVGPAASGAAGIAADGAAAFDDDAGRDSCEDFTHVMSAEPGAADAGIPGVPVVLKRPRSRTLAEGETP